MTCNNILLHNYQLMYHLSCTCYSVDHNVTVSPSPSLSVPSGSPKRVAIVSTSSHSFTIKWGPPPKEQQNGEILSYEVEYGEDTSTVVNDTTRGMRYTAENLTTDKVYQFRVAATTVNGTGPFSEWSEVGTIPTGMEIAMMFVHMCACVCVCVCLCVHP